MIETGHLDELRAALPALQAEANQQAGPRGVAQCLEDWYGVFPQPQRTEPEWLSFYRGYTEVCGMFSRAALKAALSTWAKTPGSDFLPKPAELRLLALASVTTAGRLYGKAKQVLTAADNEVERQRIEEDMKARGTTAAEQRKMVLHMLAQFSREAAPGRARANELLKHGTRAVDERARKAREAAAPPPPAPPAAPEEPGEFV